MNEITIEDDSFLTSDCQLEETTLPQYVLQDAEVATDTDEQIDSLTDAQDALAHYSRPSDQLATDGDHAAHGNQAETLGDIADLCGLHDVALETQREDEATALTVRPADENAQDSDSTPPRIEVKKGKIGETIDAVEALLADTGRFFQRNGQVVEIRQAKDADGYQVKVMSIDSLLVSLALMSQWWREDSRSGTWSRCDPIDKVCRLLLKGELLQRLKPLRGLARQPHLRADGSMCLAQGYDDATCIYGAFDAHAITVDPSPGVETARAAAAELEDLMSEVAFASERDKSAAMAAILTAAVRPSLPHAPMFHVTAHQPGSGKSYLCDLISLFAGPKPSSKASFPSSNDECGKMLLSQLMGSPAVIEFDNMSMVIKPHDKLCTALTSEQIEGRVLGTSTMVGLSTRALFLSSGNNVKPIGDMLRRTMVINLDPKVETPSARKFSRPTLLEDVRNERTRYVTAALTVVRAWLTSGAPPAECLPLGSFGEWSKWCRESLIWLGFEDPAAGLFEGLECDPEKLLLGRVLEGWHARYGSSVTMVRNLVPTAMRPDADEDFRDALIEASGGIDTVNVRKLGHWLSRQEGRVVGGLRLLKARKTGSAQNWCVEPLA